MVRAPPWAFADTDAAKGSRNDPLEENNMVGSRAERDIADKLRETLRRVEAPLDQFARLGMA